MTPQPKKLFLIAIITTLTITIVSVLVIAFFNQSGSLATPPFPGTIVLNLPQSTPLLNQPLSFHLSATGENGLTLCQLPLLFSLTLPSGQTQDLPVIPGPACESTQTSTEPGYTASFTPNQPGTYTATLTMDNSPIHEPLSFTVDPQPTNDLTFTRWSASSNSLQERYSMVITAAAAQPFQGTITDTLPDSYDFAWYGAADIGQQADQKTISWDIDLQAGESLELKYDYTASDLPGPHTFGPLTTNTTPIPNTEWKTILIKNSGD